jgi:Arrestin (or S-antigen), N-terminal domain
MTKIPTGDRNDQLMPGTYEYPFRFRLPSKLPCSFEAKYGHIRYSIKATVKRGMFKFDYKTQRNLVVSSVVDLNAIESARVCSLRVGLRLEVGANQFIVLFNLKIIISA